jgi:chemotaxis protein CheD
LSLEQGDIMDVKEIKIGIGDLNIATPPDKLITIGLGSCIGIALIDSVNKVVGMSHIMLPDSTGFTNQTNLMKFANLAIPVLVDKMIAKGAKLRNMKSKIAGGACMFNFPDKPTTLDIGKRNTLAVKDILNDLCIPILSEDTGGSSGRTMIIDSETCKVFIKTVGKEIKEL